MSVSSAISTKSKETRNTEDSDIGSNKFQQVIVASQSPTLVLVN